MGYHVPENRLQGTLPLLAIGGWCGYSQVGLQGEGLMPKAAAQGSERDWRFWFWLQSTFWDSKPTAQSRTHITCWRSVGRPVGAMPKAMPRGAPQCDDGTGWQVHGLWPQYAGGGWPEYCDTDGAVIPAAPRPAQWRISWATAGLAWHQWGKKHGRCSGLSADAYFGQTRAAFEGAKLALTR